MLFIKTTKWMELKYLFISEGINKWWSNNGILFSHKKEGSTDYMTQYA